MLKEEFFYPSADKEHSIHAVLWMPEGEVRGVVQLVHGICEYAERYQPFAAFLTARGFAVTGNDHLGHGQSVKDPSEYGYFTRWSDLVEDVRALRELVGEKLPGLPYFLLGHSMGSFVVRTYLIDYPGTVSGCLLSGTAYYSPSAAVAGKLITALGDPHKVNRLFYAISIGSYNKALGHTRTNADWICRDEAVVDAYLADPMCNFPTKGGMNHAMMAGLGRVASAGELAKMDKTTPLFLFAGDRDPVGGMGRGVKKVKALFDKAGCRDVTMKLYPGGRHEMLNETDKDQVYADVLAWLEARCGLPAPREEPSSSATV